jgi:stage II sporulation SpoAA-like protein
MPVQIQYQPDDICVLRISGILKRSEFGAEQSALTRKIDSGSKPRLLVILENFEGWERGADWNDLDFLFLHSGKISKIAIVAESRWETLALAFAGAGVRRAPVKFFPPKDLDQARNWLAE